MRNSALASAVLAAGTGMTTPPSVLAANESPAPSDAAPKPLLPTGKIGKVDYHPAHPRR